MNILIPYGKMSLTNYEMQGIVGTSLFYGYGLNLYPYFGDFLCLILALAVFAIQVVFSHYYLINHKSGPLESLWRKATWIRKSNKETGGKKKKILV